MPVTPSAAWPLDALFSAAGTLAFVGWFALALSPSRVRWAVPARLVAGRLMPALLALLYVVLIAAHWGDAGGRGGYGSLAQVRMLFDVPGLLLAGWVHYLAFDLFVGARLAQRAADEGLAHVLLLPILALTFLFGPAGLLAYEIVHAIRGRRQPGANASPQEMPR